MPNNQHAERLREMAEDLHREEQEYRKAIKSARRAKDKEGAAALCRIADEVTEKISSLEDGAKALNEYQWRPIGQMGIRCEDWDRTDLYLFGRINARGVVEVVSAEFASWHGFTHAIRLPKFGGEVAHVG
jgi:hypothetical protein